MKLALVKGAASQTILLFIQNSSVTTGAGLTGLVFNSAGLTCYYARPRAAAVAVTLATQTVTGAFSSGGFVEIDATNMPGVYRFDPPDAALATGVDSVAFLLKGATNMAQLPLEIQLTSFDLNDADPDVNMVKVSGTPQTAGDIVARLPAALVAGRMDSSTGAMAAGVITSAAHAAGAIDAAAIAANAIGASELDADIVIDIWSGNTIAEAYAADGAAATPAQLLYMIWCAVNEFAISGTTMTGKKLDGTTTAMTWTLDDGTSPTSRTRAT